MAIKKQIFGHRLVIDFRYQSINCYRLSSIVIDYRFHRLIRPGLMAIFKRPVNVPLIGLSDFLKDQGHKNLKYSN